MAILRGRDGTAYIPTTLTAFASQATTEAAYIYQIDNAAMRIWDPNTALVISGMTGVLNESWYLDGVDYFTGRIKATTTGDTILVSGKYVNGLTAVADIYGWSINFSRGMAETTPLGEAWRQLTALGMQATVTLNRYRTNTTFDNVPTESYVIIELQETATQGFILVAHRSALNWTKAAGAVDQETVTLEPIGPVSRY